MWVLFGALFTTRFWPFALFDALFGGGVRKISRYLGRYLNTRTSFSPSCHRENTPREFLERLLGVFTAFVEGRFSRFAFAEPFLRGAFAKFRVCWTVFETARGASSSGFYMPRVGWMFLFVGWMLDRPLLRWMNVGWAKFLRWFWKFALDERWMGVGWALDGAIFTRQNDSSTYRGKIGHFTSCFKKLFSLFIAAHILSRTRREFRT